MSTARLPTGHEIYQKKKHLSVAAEQVRYFIELFQITHLDHIPKDTSQLRGWNKLGLEI